MLEIRDASFGKSRLYISAILSTLPLWGIGSPSLSFCSTTTDELSREFGDLSRLHVVEIARGNTEYTQPFREGSGCASYTLMDVIDVPKLPLNTACDLVICTEMPLTTVQNECAESLERIVEQAPYGYIRNVTDHSADILIRSLLSKGRQGRVVREMSAMVPGKVQVLWKPTDAVVTSALHDIPRLVDASQSAVTYDLNGGRVGDSLISYFHAKWIAMEYRLPFLYKPFPDSEVFRLSDEDQALEAHLPFQHVVTISKKEDVEQVAPSTLIVVPYFPDCPFECLSLPFGCAYFPMQWSDPKFNGEVRRCLQPKNCIAVRDRPQGCISVAVHVRRGGTWDNYGWISQILPLKFPPDSYYIEQIQRIARIFPNQPLYVYVFTDDLRPDLLVKTFAGAIQNPYLTFDWNQVGQSADKFEDFYTMAQFDCLIRPGSNFSLMAAQLGKHALIIFPTHCYFDQGRIIVDAVEVQFCGSKSK